MILENKCRPQWKGKNNNDTTENHQHSLKQKRLADVKKYSQLTN